MWFTEKGDEACTEFGDKKGNSQNSVMNSSQAGIAHIYDHPPIPYGVEKCKKKEQVFISHHVSSSSQSQHDNAKEGSLEAI